MVTLVGGNSHDINLVYSTKEINNGEQEVQQEAHS